MKDDFEKRAELLIWIFSGLIIVAVIAANIFYGWQKFTFFWNANH